MLTAILSLLLFICIGVMTYLILSRRSIKGIDIGMNLDKKTVGMNIDINKLQNRIIIGEILKIADNLRKVQPLLCEQYKDKLRELINKLYAQTHGTPPSCDDAKTGTEAMLGQLIRINDDYPMTGELIEINKSIIESIKKIAEEVSNIICNKSLNKLDKNKALKLLERGINMICNIGYKNNDYL